MEQSLLDEIRRGASELASHPNVTRPSRDEVKAAAERFGTPTNFGNYNWASNVKNRSSAVTVNLGSSRVAAGALTQKKRDIKKGAPQTVRQLHDYTKRVPLVQIECTMGTNSDFAPRCTLYVSTYRPEMVRLAHMMHETFFPAGNWKGPEFTVIVIPEWPEKDRRVLAFPEAGVTYVLGTDYFEEIKTAFLRMAMWEARQKGMLGLHAGTKIVHAKGSDDRLRKLGIIMFGIAATGKTTHACHDHGLDQPGEGVEIVQDEFVFWRQDGSALGTERGFYVKTEGLSPEKQPLLYDAAANSRALLENVMVDYEGNAHFHDRTLTVNGRAIVQKDGLGRFTSQMIDLPGVDELDGLIMAFMVRKNSVLPIASKLTPEQAGIAFILSESIDISGADARLLGELKAEAGIHPFSVGEPAEEANLFYSLLKTHEDKIGCYMLNTGGIGEIVEQGIDGAKRIQKRATRVAIPEMACIIRGIARGTIQWREDPDWILETPGHVEDVDMTKFDPGKHYDQHRLDSLIADLRVERMSYVEQFEGLDPAIRNAAEF